MASSSTTSSLVSLGWSGSQISVSEGVIFVPWLAVITAALDILELAGVIPDPISLLLSLFAGRPREEASIQQAQRLMTARNPAARLAGIQLTRMVNEWDIVTSTGGSGRQILDSWSAQFEQNMVAQGVSLERAKQLMVNATSEAAQTGLPLEPEMLMPLPAQLGFNGPASVASDLMTQYQKAIAAGKSIADALQTAEAYVWKNTNLRLLFSMQVGPFIQTTPQAQQVIPGADGSCPSGYTLDTSSSMCTLPGQPGTPSSGPPPVTSPPVSQPDPEGDEITNDLCAQMATNASAIINAINGIAGADPPDPTCCANVVTALGNMITTLGSIATAVSSIGGSSGVDLTGVVSAIEQLTTAVQGIPATPAPDFTNVVNALNQIAKQIGTSSGNNLQPVVDAINAFAKIVDVKPATLQWLAQNGYIDSAVVQLANPGDFGDALVAVIRTMAWKSFQWIANLVGVHLTDSSFSLGAVSEGLAKYISDAVSAALAVGGDPMYPLVKGIVEGVTGILKPASPPAIGAEGVDPNLLLSKTLAPVLIINGISLIADYFGWEISEQLHDYVEKVSEFTGLAEVAEIFVGQLMAAGPVTTARMQARAAYRQELPGASSLAGLTAQRLLDSQSLETYLPFTGLPPQLHDATLAAAYRGFNARQMLRLIETGLFSQGDITDELNFAGMRDASQKRMLLAAPYLATAPQRNQLIAALENAYINGLISDLELSQQVDQAEQNTDRDSLIMARVQLQKRVAFTKELESAYSQQFTIGLIPEPQYQGLLEGIGLQPDWINSRIARDIAKMAATTYRKELAAELALERATAAKERTAAVKNFTAGNIDSAGLLAALLLTGLNATQAAAWVDLATLQKAGSLRWIYGRQLAPSDAALLRARVTALSDQRKRLQITDAAYIAALAALGIPEHYINALRSTADAMITPKTSAVTIPVET